jgi:hypothetical protein
MFQKNFVGVDSNDQKSKIGKKKKSNVYRSESIIIGVEEFFFAIHDPIPELSLRQFLLLACMAVWHMLNNLTTRGSRVAQINHILYN